MYILCMYIYKYRKILSLLTQMFIYNGLTHKKTDTKLSQNLSLKKIE